VFAVAQIGMVYRCYTDQGKRNILRAMKRRKSEWIGHMLRSNCLVNTLLKER
jgi:hypothetical protein